MKQATSVIITVPDTGEIESEHVPIVAKAQALVVHDAESHRAALELGNIATARKATIVQMLAPAKKAADQAHKQVTALERALCAPFDQVRAIVSTKCLEYDRAAREAAEEQRRRFAEAARKAEEERQLADAMAAEAAGDTEQAEQIMAEEPTVPVIHVEPEIAKVQGASTRATWKAEVADLAALLQYVADHPECHSYVAPVMPVLNALARSQKELMRVPGVRAVKEESLSFSRGG